MNTTTRKFPRTLREAFPGDYRESAQGIAGPVVVPTRTFRGSIDEQMRKAREFVQVYRLYRNHHGRTYSARIAFGCVYQGLPF